MIEDYRKEMLENDDDLQSEHSVPSLYQEFVRFINTTNKIVDIYWITFKGEAKWYKSLKGSESFNVNTFVEHPWIFRDNVTGERLLANGERICKLRRNSERLLLWRRRELKRLDIKISFPLRNLKVLAMTEILNVIKDEEAAKSLELPHTLRQELLYLIKKYKIQQMRKSNNLLSD